MRKWKGNKGEILNIEKFIENLPREVRYNGDLLYLTIARSINYYVSYGGWISELKTWGSLPKFIFVGDTLKDCLEQLNIFLMGNSDCKLRKDNMSYCEYIQIK